MTKQETWCFFCNAYNTLLNNGVDLSEVNSFLRTKGMFCGYIPLDYRARDIWKLSIRDITQCLYLINTDVPFMATFKGKKVSPVFNPMSGFNKRIPKKQSIQKKITFYDDEKKFGHTSYDYKKDGTFRKGRENEHEYYETVKKEVICDAVVIDGILVGYTRSDKRFEKYHDINLNGEICYWQIVYNLSGKTVPVVSRDLSGNYMKTTLLVAEYNGKWVALWPYKNPSKLTPLWIGEYNDDVFYEKNNVFWKNLDIKYVLRNSFENLRLDSYYAEYMANQKECASWIEKKEDRVEYFKKLFLNDYSTNIIELQFIDTLDDYSNDAQFVRLCDNGYKKYSQTLEEIKSPR